jgi:hypothetical protein
LIPNGKAKKGWPGRPRLEPVRKIEKKTAQAMVLGVWTTSIAPTMKKKSEDLEYSSMALPGSRLGLTPVSSAFTATKRKLDANLARKLRATNGALSRLDSHTLIFPFFLFFFVARVFFCSPQQLTNKSRKDRKDPCLLKTNLKEDSHTHEHQLGEKKQARSTGVRKQQLHSFSACVEASRSSASLQRQKQIGQNYRFAQPVRNSQSLQFIRTLLACERGIIDTVCLFTKGVLPG